MPKWTPKLEYRVSSAVLRCHPGFVTINIRIDPERIRLDRVSKGDMAGSTFSKTFAREDPESTCHMLEHPFALSVDVFDGWNPVARNTAGCQQLKGI